jgi:hypothetical protein
VFEAGKGPRAEEHFVASEVQDRDCRERHRYVIGIDIGKNSFHVAAKAAAAASPMLEICQFCHCRKLSPEP